MYYTKTIAAGFFLIKKNIVVSVGYMNNVSMYIWTASDSKTNWCIYKQTCFKWLEINCIF